MIDEFAVMVRPLSAALALAEAMKAQLAATEDGIPTDHHAAEHRMRARGLQQLAE